MSLMKFHQTRAEVRSSSLNGLIVNPLVGTERLGGGVVGSPA